jgi:serine/threonine protein kinase
LLIADLAHGLAVIHGKGFVHTTLYPENVFIKIMSDEKPVACLGGFEWMVRQGAALTRAIPDGHPSAKYAAPELAQHSAKKATQFMDIYAFGMLSHLVMTGKEGGDVEAVRAFIEDATVRGEIRNLVRQCTDATPTDRPAIAQVQAMMTEIRNNTENLEDF